LKIARKAALEAELKKLTAEIEADKKKIVELPESTEKIQKEATTALIESNQLKTKLSALSRCHMDLPGPTTLVGTRTDYSVGPWDYLTCAPRYLMA
jgi:predicted RNase H-like nuclease (RuvC/YqgF family)